MKKSFFVLVLIFFSVTSVYAENWYGAYKSKQQVFTVAITEHSSDYASLVKVNELYEGFLVYDVEKSLFYFMPSDQGMAWVAGSNVMTIQSYSGSKNDKVVIMGCVSYNGGYLYVDVTGKASNSYAYVSQIMVSGNITAISEDAHTKISFSNVRLYPDVIE